MDSPFSYATIVRGSSKQTPIRAEPPAQSQPLKSVRPQQSEKIKPESSIEDKSEDNKENIKEQSLLERKELSFEENEERYQLEKQNASKFGLFSFQIFVRIAKYLGPEYSCDLGRTCKFLVRQLFNEKVWKLISTPTAKSQITFKLESSKQLDGFDPNKEKELLNIPLNGTNIQNLPVEDYNNEMRRKRLANYWMALSSVAQEERDAKFNATKKKDVDPLIVTARQPDLKAKLGGGISIEASYFTGNKGRKGSERPPTKVLITKDLSVIPVWLNGIIDLLRGKMKVTLPYSNGNVTLTRIDRGGSVVKFVLDNSDPSETKTFYFSLAKFCIALRDAAKEYRSLVGSCLQIIVDRSKEVKLTSKNGEDDSEQRLQAQRIMEKETLIRSILSHQKLAEGVKVIKSLLKGGAVSGASLAAYFKERKEEKQRVNAQRALEYSNMYKFLLKHLPSDYDAVQANAELLTSNVENIRLARQNNRKLNREQFEAKKALQDQQRKARPPPPRENITKIVGKNLLAAKEKEAEDLKKLLEDPVKKAEYDKKQTEEAKKRAEERAEAEKKKAENRVRKVVQKTKDKEGFILEKIQFVKGLSPPEPEPEPEPETKGKKQQQQQQGKGKKGQKAQVKKQQQVDEPVQVPKPKEEEIYLGSNPYSVIEDSDYDTLNEALFKPKKNQQQEAQSPAKQQKGVQKHPQQFKPKPKAQPKGKPTSPKGKQVQKKGGKWAKQQKQQDTRTKPAPSFWEANPVVFQAVIGFLLLLFLAFVYSFVISGIST